ncbi:protein NRT1/ PTR FAMILY 5.8-like [Nymphaea colorata]|nr:protein NRT1/ PTR FAMILY 5.8-like [Nymphaea colorata]
MAITRRSWLNKSCILIIVVASVERFAYKGVAANLVSYLTDVLHESTSVAAKNINTWYGVTSMLPLVGALLADSYGDRYSTILASSLLYILGLASLSSWALLWTWFPKRKRSSSPLFLSLYLTSIGQGGYNPCLQAFGADQLEEEEDVLPRDSTEENTSTRSLFFQQWYFGICSGSLLGVIILSYVQDTFGWGIGFAIPAAAMMLSALCFSCGSPCYKRKQSKTEKPTGSMIDTIRAIGRKMMGRSLPLTANDEHLAELELQEKAPMVDNGRIGVLQTNTCKGIISGEDARIVLRLLPIWATCLMFAVVFQQPTTFFIKQGITMKRNIGRSFEIPPATLQSVITISIILLMPLYDPLLIPLIKRITGSEQGINTLQRICIGMFLSIMAMVIAAILENKRLQMQTFDNGTRVDIVHMSIFWLVPQYILLGISDVFTVVGMQEFFYSQVPSRMRTIGIALYTSVFGFGSFLSAILISMIELGTRMRGQRNWFSDDLSEARLDLYFWLLSLLSTLSMVLFISMSKYYSHKYALANNNCK